MLSAIFHFIKEKAINKSVGRGGGHIETSLQIIILLLLFCAGAGREKDNRKWLAAEHGEPELVAYFCAFAQLINLQGNIKSDLGAIALRFMFYCFGAFS